MLRRYEMRFSGVGGQGAILAGVIMAEAAVHHEGLNAIQSPTYTAAVRGGHTKVDVIVSSEEIYHPQIRHLDFFLALHQKAYDKYYEHIKEEGIVLVDPNLTPTVDERHCPVYKIPFYKIAKEELGEVVVANIMAVGAITRLTSYLSEGSVRKAVANRVPKAYLDLNMRAFDMGVELGADHRKAR